MLVRFLIGLTLCQHLLCSGALFDACYDPLPTRCRCFNLLPPYTNSLFHMPASPAEIGTQFYLYTSSNPTQPQRLTAGNAQALGASSWNKQLDTKFVVHGFTDSWQTDWVALLVAELLQQNVNVIVVDWQNGAKGPNYYQAAANTRVVGAMIAYLVLAAESLGQPASRIHVIGHSLGAQSGGYAGQCLQGRLGRISGLDPAGPQFEPFSTAVKLDKTDAVFVDVIHTDAESLLLQLGLGTRDLSGHVDFFPNRGHDMPGCPTRKISWTTLVTGGFNSLTDDVACSHNRAPRYFTASINDNEFQAYPCASSGGNCQQCGTQGCAKMGYHATPAARGIYTLTTQAQYPY